MNSTAKHPFLFFDYYFDNQIQKDLNDFYDNIIEEEEVLDIDKVKQIVTILTPEFKNNYATFSFEQNIKNRIKKEINISRIFIESGFEKRFSDKKEVRAYASFLRIKMSNLINNNSCKEFAFLVSYLEELGDLIDRYSKLPTNYSYTPSFVLLADSPVEQLSKIKDLYKLLNEKPSVISCSIEEFTNAFTGKEIEEGINWLVTAKNNNYVSKPSLLYFLDELINKGFLSKNIINDLYKFIRYVFRDHKGNDLKNLKQSREAMSENPASKDRIDIIISSL